MEKLFSSDDFSQQEFDLYRLMAQKGDPSWPVYSGDVAAAFRIHHRAFKSMIEADYSQLQASSKTKIYRVRHRRKGYARAMDGYLLSLRTALQVLYSAAPSLSALCRPEFIFACFCSENFLDHLN